MHAGYTRLQEISFKGGAWWCGLIGLIWYTKNVPGIDSPHQLLMSGPITIFSTKTTDYALTVCVCESNKVKQ